MTTENLSHYDSEVLFPYISDATAREQEDLDLALALSLSESRHTQQPPLSLPEPQQPPRSLPEPRQNPFSLPKQPSPMFPPLDKTVEKNLLEFKEKMEQDIALRSSLNAHKNNSKITTKIAMK